MQLQKTGSSDPVVFKIVIIPRGNDLVCFTFTVPQRREQEWQDSIDGFVRTVLGKSRKQGYMTPMTSGTDEGG